VPVKWGLRIAIGLVALVALFGGVLFARGSFERISLSRVNGRISPAAVVCLSRTPRDDRRLLERCVRVRGTLLHVSRGYDAERTRLEEIHLLVSAHFHLYVVKLVAPFPTSLRLGHEVTVIGPLVETRPTHFGVHEVEAFSFGSGNG
jgi:hypothetical protein